MIEVEGENIDHPGDLAVKVINLISLSNSYRPLFLPLYLPAMLMCVRAHTQVMFVDQLSDINLGENA